MRKISKHRERGSLALEQVLFIGAIVALSSAIYTFYGKLGTYFQNVNIPAVQGTVSGSTSG